LLVALVVSVGSGVTFTVAVTGLLLHPLLVPVTVYTVVAPGLAVVVPLLGLPKPVELVHVYVPAPLALSVVLLPWHTV
jgi:hypothetical protein